MVGFRTLGWVCEAWGTCPIGDGTLSALCCDAGFAMHFIAASFVIALPLKQAPQSVVGGRAWRVACGGVTEDRSV